MATWPTALDYMTAFRTKDGRALLHPDLQGIEFRVNPVLPGRPLWSAAGNFATVFSAARGPERFALRVFTRDPGLSRLRYRHLQEHRIAHDLSFVAGAEWLDGAVKVGDHELPALKMEWVDGVMLQQWLGDHNRQGDEVAAMADQWLRICTQLRAEDMAHGDLQPRNVMVTPDGALRLVDLDGIWLPELRDTFPQESGHPHFQHPDRQRRGTWHEHIDAFSALVIYLSLRAIAADAGLWEELFNEENLLLSSDDYAAEAAGRSPAWRRLAESADDDMAALLEMLSTFCRADADVRTDLAEMLHDRALYTRAPDPRATTPGTTPGAPTRDVLVRLYQQRSGTSAEAAPLHALAGEGERVLVRPGEPPVASTLAPEAAEEVVAQWPPSPADPAPSSAASAPSRTPNRSRTVLIAAIAVIALLVVVASVALVLRLPR